MKEDYQPCGKALEGAGAWWRDEQVLWFLCEDCLLKDLDLAHLVCHLKVVEEEA